MKTKSLILTALLTVAGTAGLMAQSSNVYSQNIVGYVSTTVPVGYSMVSFQLKGSPNNQLPNVIPNPPINTSVFKFNPATGGYIQNQYYNFGWDGDDTTITLDPGEGVFIYAPSQFTNTVVGEVQLGSTNAIPVGYSIRSSATPRQADLDTLSFPHVVGLNVFQYDVVSGGYRQNQYYNFGWDGDDNGSAPTPKVGESFFVYSPGASSWTQNLSVGP